MVAKKAPQKPTREPLCPSLPTEVWINILRFHTDLAHLWNTVRLVSSPLRACVERAFGEHFLPDIHIDFQLEKYNLGGKSKRPEISTRFARRGKGEDGHIAWFKDSHPDADSTREKGKRGRQHHLKIMLTAAVFREQHRLEVLKARYQADAAKKIQSNNARLRKGEKLLPSDYPAPWATAGAEIRKEIRRARLKEHYRDNEEMVWAIDSLKHFEQYGAAAGSARALKLNAELPGAGLGEKWFGSRNLVQELYLDEWSCMHRIDTKVEHIRLGI
ncbi:conserved hypothetical protein [Pyrenophora tritici-repentis Pt-1C-BFP]|uniref:Uncharacterized protein n=1 Tax=Pyrenophora tritici-repentis (strain Pt-1C-BFP) TaxID=426418 RepID=B2W3B9_PYRTR|nr:uncharacterized protein PTRG_04969 [Pyrenophora tritici-repentis Pt-1C-BFP]EDU47876.1 conserved hypothetical protein [Pyrenophora tritici-repentis Pt-1C-BFP]